MQVFIVGWNIRYSKASRLIIGHPSIGSWLLYGLGIVEDPVEVFDLHATVLRLLGLDHMRLTIKFQGREFRLTDVHGQVVHKLTAGLFGDGLDV